MKIAVVGSRKFKDKKIVYKQVIDLCKNENSFISGGAKGVDSWAIEAILLENTDRVSVSMNYISYKIYKADWEDLSQPDAIIKNNKYGPYDARAGMRRNQTIVNEADKIIAFWDGKSSGTKSTIDLAIKAGKPIDIYVR